MVQQSQNRWHAPPPEQSGHSSETPSVASWMQDVLGRPAPSQTTSSQPYHPNPVNAGYERASSQPDASQRLAPDLQSRLAAIAKNIQALESRVVGDPAPHHPATAPMGDPLEALRRRKMQLERGAGQHPGPAPHATMDRAPTYETTVEAAPQSAPDGIDQLATHLDEQLYQLTHAVNDIRKLAETSAAGQAGLSQKVEALQNRVERPVPPPVTGPALEPSVEPSLAQLSAQVRAVQDAISAMPKLEAVQSLEDGYRHILARLDGLKMDGTPDDKIDALYAEVSSLREVLDGLSSSGTASMVGEMRSMIAQLEARPNGNGDANRIAEALESVKEMARGEMPGQDSTFIREAIGSVVERLVALEARIEALAAGADDSVVTKRLDAIQSEMARLSTFQDEARGLTSALDTIRQEMRDASFSAEGLNFGEHFSTLQRFEEMASGYTAQVAELSSRLNALDGTLDAQAEMAREIAALSHQVNSFTAAMPIREIEQALLDLTGRVTALQEDTGAERLAMAVRSLGERVESCLKSIPKTEAIVDAVEARLDSRMAGLDTRLDGLHKAISNADAPLIDHLSKRLETLIAAMPAPSADEALASLERQLADINARQSQSDAVSGEEVASLHKELARVGASVELASNRELQRSIVEQVRDLADRIDAARTTGNADILPEIEQQIEVLAARFQSLGLFDPSTAATVPEYLIERLEERLDADPTAAGLDDLQTELVSLREDASDQDKRMYATLESMQSALETVIERIGALETDDRAARTLASEAARDHPVDAPKARQPEKASLHTSKPDVSRPETAMAETEEAAPEPGDAKTLLRQLSGAMDEPVKRADAEPPMQAQPAVASTPQTATPDIASQRASFIAAARRAAQTAALQAGGGVPRSTQAMPSALDTLQPSQDLADPNTRIEPDLEPAESDLQPAQDPFEEADHHAGARGKKKKTPKAEQAGKQRSLSRAMLVALVLFTVGLGLFVLNLIAPVDQIGDSVIGPAEAPADDGAAAPVLAPRVVGDDPVEAGRIPQGPATAPDDPVAARDVLGEAPQPVPVQEPASLVDNQIESTTNDAADAVADTLVTRSTVGTGFERDRGPIMAETPQLSVAAPILPPPANDLGPLLNPTPPPLPSATADSLPEAIGSPRLRVAAASGDPAAEFEIAARFMEGRFVPQDLAAAAHWYGRAAQQGIAPAAYRLGSFYEQGRGVERNRDGAVAWYERAALDGNPRAMHNLAVMAAEGAGQAPDFALAAAWFIPAANRGLADSQFNLAVLYARGMGVERDLMESYKWFALAANAGDSEAVNRRDEVAGVLGEETLALARARVDNWVPIPVERASVEVPRPDGGWDDASTRAGLSVDATPAQRLVAEAQNLLSQRGYDPGPADGLLGPRTNNAVRAFRQSIGLGDSDVIDQALIDALRAGTSL